MCFNRHDQPIYTSSTTMNRSIAISIIIAIAVLIAGYFLLRNSDRIQTNTDERRVYTSQKYGFSFEIPPNYDVRKYTEEAVSLGHQSGDAFEAEAEVQIVNSGEEGGYESFNEFLFESMRTACAADSPNESVYCDKKIQTQPFTSSNGLSGEVFYLNRIHENLRTGSTTIDAFGPIFAFNIQANVPESNYSALVIRPPANSVANAVNSEFIRSIANTVQIETVD